MLSQRVIAYYGLIRDSESLPATYGFAAEAAAPKEIGLRWESRGSPIYSAGLDSRAASLTPVPRRVQMTVAHPGFQAATRPAGRSRLPAAPYHASGCCGRTRRSPSTEAVFLQRPKTGLEPSKVVLY